MNSHEAQSEFLAAPLLSEQVPDARRIVGGQAADAFDKGLDDHVVVASEDVTTITGTVADQVALHGLLSRIRGLGPPLLSDLDRIERQRQSDAA